MKHLIERPRRETQQQAVTGEAEQRDVGVRPEQKTENEYSVDSSFDWEAPDRIENNDPGTNTLVQDQCDYEVTVPHSTFKLVDDPLSRAEEDIGVDPYNSSRFETENR